MRPWYIAWLVSLLTLLAVGGVAAAIVIIVVFAWRVVTGPENWEPSGDATVTFSGRARSP